MSRNRPNYHKEWYQKNKEKILEKSDEEKKLKKEYDTNYRQKNKEKLNEYYNSEEYKNKKKEYYLKNKDKIKEKNKEYQNKNKDKIKEKNKEYQDKNKDKIIEYHKVYKQEKRKNNYLFKIQESLRSSIRTSLKDKGYTKKSRTFEILGCSYEDFKIHLESQFLDWMNWSNYGNPEDGIYELNKTWDIDHIIPISSATNEDELLKLNHYTNLQPLCSYYNRFVKKDKL